jgi:hypothetical protein
VKERFMHAASYQLGTHHWNIDLTNRQISYDSSLNVHSAET